jgi:hypothetical protein
LGSATGGGGGGLGGTGGHGIANTVPGAAGGAPGAAVVLNSNTLTWQRTGNRYGTYT